MQYEDQINNPKSFRSLTGFTHSQFLLLLPCFAAAHDDCLSEYEMIGKRRSQSEEFLHL
jgi:hypothetical protein